MSQIFCTECGFRNELSSKFCPSCGNKLSAIQNVPEPVTILVNPENNTNAIKSSKIVMPDGSIYEGELKDGIANGFGKLTYPEPDGGDPKYYSPYLIDLVYEGNFLNGKKHGFGKLYNPQYCYEGEWKHNQKSGFGKLTMQWAGSFTEYNGEFENDKKQGKGFLKVYGETLTPHTFEGFFSVDQLREGVFNGSFVSSINPYTVNYSGTFLNISNPILLLDQFPIWDGKLVHTWAKTGISSTHIIELGRSESYNMMIDEAYDEDDEDDEEED